MGNIISTLSTLLVVVTLVYIGWTVVKQKDITHWGRRIALLAILGLVVCCFVATRDSYHLSVQASFDSTVTAGLFALDSLQSNLCCIAGGIIALTGISSIFVKNQHYRRAVFFILSAAFVLKVLIIEISRWVML